jgi:hypothetical protein
MSLTGDKISNFSPVLPEDRYRTQAKSKTLSLEMRKLSPVNPLVSNLK